NDETGKQTLTAQVRVEERPRFTVVSTETDLSVGATGPINVTLRNVGSERATDATVTLTSRSASVTIGGGSSDSRFAGSWAPGEEKTVSFEGSVAGSAENQRYALAAQVTYEDANGNAGTSKSLSTGFVPQPSQFAIREVNSTLQVGADGRLSATIVNRGSTAVSNVVVSFTPSNPNVRPLETEYSVGRLGPGEAASFDFEVAIAENGGAGPRQFSFDVRYSRRDEASTSTDTIDIRADVAPEQRFRITDVESTLRVGEEGRLRATVVNPSETTVENAVVVIEPSSPTVNPVETEYAIGTLGPGETAAFDFAIEIAENADGGPRQFTLHVRYRDGDGDLRRSDPLSVLADVGAKQDAFAVEGVETAVAAGESGTLTLRVTNTGGTALSDVSAKLFTDSPLSADDDEAFIEELGPGESAEISFEVSAAGGATTGKVYPVSLDFQYVDAEGDTLLSDTYKIPVRVRATEGGGPPLAAIGGVLALVLAVGGYVLYRRR
ncbi:MAG: NEW3 domain-containing protein, partial [Halobacteriales archaeon]